MALVPKDTRGQMLAAGVLLAGAVLYFLYAGVPLTSVPGYSQLSTRRDSLQNVIDSLDAQVQAANRVVRVGAIARLERALAEYRASLDQMRTLVPAGEEVPNLLDDVSSRAKVRGANVAMFVPAALESGAPFDTKRARVTVTGQFDQIGEYLSDIASLPRIIVPYDVRIERLAPPGGVQDTSAARVAMLQATFQIRTFVKPTPIDTTARPNAAPATRSGG